MKTLLPAVAAAIMLAAAPALADIPSTQPVRRGPAALSYILGPLVFLAEFQASLSPEKASCWNNRAGEVSGCRLVKQPIAQPLP
jgi:hypothetical protein